MRPIDLEVTEVIEEGDGIATLRFDREFDVSAGNYGMFWVRGVDEVPMSFSYPDGITVRAIGETTQAMTEMEVGDSLGVRGPFGESFDLPDSDSGEVVVVGGGTGMAPVALLTEEAAREGLDVTTLIGAATADEVVFEQRLSSLDGVDVRVATDDGTKGHEGYVTELLDGYDADDVDMVASCGPEPMMAKVLERYDEEDVEVRFSLERYMKCGIGICGSCCIDDTGSRVCADGPVYDGDSLRGGEFGVYHRDAAGRKEEF
ncbi:MAG: dihydroorotate dehydrogenase electron transfer subunit [Halobacteria archaeon]|nr:dihydroorotate dehydrogenase electron transfer subunit [Halobacteria archaeon]